MRRTHPVAQSGGVEIQHYRCTCVGPQGFGTHDLSVACAGQLLLVRVSGARCPRAHTQTHRSPHRLTDCDSLAPRPVHRTVRRLAKIMHSPFTHAQAQVFSPDGDALT